MLVAYLSYKAAVGLDAHQQLDILFVVFFFWNNDTGERNNAFYVKQIELLISSNIR